MGLCTHIMHRGLNSVASEFQLGYLLWLMITNDFLNGLPLSSLGSQHLYWVVFVGLGSQLINWVVFVLGSQLFHWVYNPHLA